MPQVPRRTQGPVESSPIQGGFNVQAPGDAFGGGQSGAELRQATQNFGSAVSKEFQRFQQQADESAVQKAENTIMESRIALENEFSQRRGEDAIGMASEFNQRLEESRSKASERLSSHQANLFAPRYNTQFLQYRSKMERHISVEGEKFADAQSEANIKLNSETARRDFDNPNARLVSLNNINRVVGDYADRKGMSKEESELYRLGTLSQAHKGVIEEFILNRRYTEARAYFSEATKEQMTEADSAFIKDKIRKSEFLGKVQDNATEIMKANPFNLNSALNATSSIDDPEEKKETREEIKLRFSEREKSRLLSEESSLRSAKVALREGRSIEEISENLSPDSELELRRFHANLRESKNPVTDPVLYQDFRLMAVTPALQDKFINTNLLNHESRLSRSDYRDLLDVQTSLRQRNNTADAKIDGWRTELEIVNTTLQSAGIETGAKASDKERKEVDEFRTLVQQETLKLQRQGQKVDANKMKEVVDDLLRQQYTGRRKRFFGIPVPLTAETTPEFKSLATTISDIDSRDVSAIDAELSVRLRRRPTRQEIIETYNSAKRRQLRDARTQ